MADNEEKQGDSAPQNDPQSDAAQPQPSDTGQHEAQPEPRQAEQQPPSPYGYYQQNLQGNRNMPNQASTNPKPNPGYAHPLKRQQNLLMFANIAGPVSLFFGGMLLSAAGLICALIARAGIVRYGKDNPQDAMAGSLLKSAKVPLIVCGIAFVLNAITVYVMWPVVMEAMNSGSLDAVLNMGTSSTGTGSGTSSTWG